MVRGVSSVKRFPGLVVGLTGGISSGKSTVRQMLVDLGARALDADQIAREVLRPGGPGFRRAVRLLRPGVLQADGSFDRAAVAKLIFGNKKLRRALEDIVHPLVIRAFQRARRREAQEIWVWDVPLLFEAGMVPLVDQVVVVWAPQRVRRARVARKISSSDFMRRERSQWPLARKRLQADVVVDNSGSKLSTRKQVKQLWHQLTNAN